MASTDRTPTDLPAVPPWRRAWGRAGAALWFVVKILAVLLAGGMAAMGMPPPPPPKPRPPAEQRDDDREP